MEDISDIEKWKAERRKKYPKRENAESSKSEPKPDDINIKAKKVKVNKEKVPQPNKTLFQELVEIDKKNNEIFIEACKILTKYQYKKI